MSVSIGYGTGYLDLDISKFQKSIEEAKSNLSNLGQKIDQATNNLSQKLSSLSFDKFNESLSKAGESVKGLGQKMLPMTASVVGLGTAVLTTGKNFETSMSQVQATLGTTKEGVEVLRKKALELGASTSFSASQVADAFGYMALLKVG